MACVRTFASLQAGGRDEQGKLAETEVGSRLLLREWRKNVRVDPIRYDVPEGGLQAVRPPCVIELPFRGHHPDAGSEAIQLAMLEPHAEEPDEALRLPDLRANVARPHSPYMRPSVRESAAVELGDNGNTSVDAAPHELDRARRLAMDNVERTLVVEAEEHLE